MRIGTVVELERVVPAGSLGGWIVAGLGGIGSSFGRHVKRSQLDAGQRRAREREPGGLLELAAVSEHAAARIR